MPRRTKRSRFRSAAKWAGVVVCVMIGAAWCVSIRAAFGYHGVLSSDYACRVTAGTLWLMHLEPRRNPSQAYFQTHGPQVQWWPVWDSYYSPSWGAERLAIPLWMPFVLVAIPTAWLWWRDRRSRWVGHCAACGYDLAGLAAGSPCPECGAAPKGRPECSHG
jgi:hypothetical protein